MPELSSAKVSRVKLYFLLGSLREAHYSLGRCRLISLEKFGDFPGQLPCDKLELRASLVIIVSTLLTQYQGAFLVYCVGGA